MVSIIENKALITGTVISISDSPDARGFQEIQLELLTTQDVDNLPNLARADEGRTIRIKMEAPKVTPGCETTLIVKKAAGQVYFALE